MSAELPTHAGVWRPRRLKRDSSGTVQLGLVISLKALARLKEAARELNVGQNHLLTVILQTFDVEALKKPLADYVASRMRHTKAGVSPEQVRAFLDSLPEEEREKFLAG